ncbi:predicted protein [Sclerotinia sclerotiorum 1980 UF-70]|uniref:Uncharacterized protein n=1 Tax=Sclerotinia sclerotiorum (strain ATCC 18683 / 1980 / Ss-1) TaxID=665079 RepID=A7E5C8_SCLS1|nr:predicted protein [Sclerotinia sclerotiorum 1980 UF-70]EDN91100.1 predicted protein [Sclerotinia sclerotiorum 1980 UF-70]
MRATSKPLIMLARSSRWSSSNANTVTVFSGKFEGLTKLHYRLSEEMLRGLCRGFAGHETAVVSCLDASGFLLHKHGFGFKISKSCKDHYDWD